MQQPDGTNMERTSAKMRAWARRAAYREGTGWLVGWFAFSYLRLPSLSSQLPPLHLPLLQLPRPLVYSLLATPLTRFLSTTLSSLLASWLLSSSRSRSLGPCPRALLLLHRVKDDTHQHIHAYIINCASRQHRKQKSATSATRFHKVPHNPQVPHDSTSVT